LGGGEIILISALILILLGAKSLPEITEGFRVGMKEFRKAAREVTKELAERFDGEYASNRQSHPILMALTLILGAACVIFVVYEFSK